LGWEYNNYLAHHGIKGQKWGVRRYQNEDGTLTNEGQSRYDSLTDRQKREYNRLPAHWQRVMDKKMANNKSYTKARQETIKRQQTAALLAVAGITTIASVGAYYGSIYGAKATHKAVDFIKNRMAQSPSWHDLKNRFNAIKTGDVVLRKSDYTISGSEFLKGVRK